MEEENASEDASQGEADSANAASPSAAEEEAARGQARSEVGLGGARGESKRHLADIRKHLDAMGMEARQVAASGSGGG